MKKIAQIFNAWKISYNPTDEQSELAAARMEICDTCEYKTKATAYVPYTHCNQCYCKLDKKVFSTDTEYTPDTKYQTCPKGFWADVERVWSLKNSKKKYDSLKK